MERRILRGPKIRSHYSKDDRDQRQAGAALSRLLWLQEQGCEFTFNLEEKASRLRARAPDWRDEFAANAARAHDGGGGFVRFDPDHSVLKDVPDEQIIERIESMDTRPIRLLVEYDPFSGLAKEEPDRALRALQIRNASGKFDRSYWERFLRKDARKEDSAEFALVIAHALLEICPDNLSLASHDVGRWFENAGLNLRQRDSALFERLWDWILKAISTRESLQDETGEKSATGRDLATEAINTPSGNLAQLLVDMLSDTNLNAATGFPDWWKNKAEQLMALEGDYGRFALLIFAHQTNFLFHWDEDWTRNHILSALNDQGGKSNRKGAFWAGFLWAARMPNLNLYKIMRPHLIQQVAEPSSDNGRYTKILARMIFAGWCSRSNRQNERLISNAEFTNLILAAPADFRNNLLWTAQRWTNNEDKALASDIVEFVKDVWPKQKSLRTTSISEKLVELALMQRLNYSDVVEGVLPLLTKVGPHRLLIPSLHEIDESVAGNFPEPTLSLLYAILPDQKWHWPYGAENALRLIIERAPELASDSRYIELNQRI